MKNISWIISVEITGKEADFLVLRQEKETPVSRITGRSQCCGDRSLQDGGRPSASVVQPQGRSDPLFYPGKNGTAQVCLIDLNQVWQDW